MLVVQPYKATLGVEPHVIHQTLSLEAQISMVCNNLKIRTLL